MLDILSNLDENKCYGCRACEQICPAGCITMANNAEGFLYPSAVISKCIDCGLCDKVCPVINVENLINKEKLKVYAAIAKNHDILSKSSSGGLMSILAEKIINDGGIVFGASFDEKFNLAHIGCDQILDLDKLRGSKYLQSDTDKTFSQVKQCLKDDRYVMYVGTPCQVGGLKAYLGKSYEKLLLVDLVCHGVPSQKLFSKFTSYLETKHKGKLIKFEFRNKSKYGWGKNYQYIIKKDTGRIKIVNKPDLLTSYGYGFHRVLFHRPSCYKCDFTQVRRVGDITLGDFWGVKKCLTEIENVRRGVSLLLINTSNGRKKLKSVKNTLELYNANIDDAVKFNQNLTNVSVRPKQRDYIYKDLESMNFDSFTQKHINSNNQKLLIIKSFFYRILFLLKIKR